MRLFKLGLPCAALAFSAVFAAPVYAQDAAVENSAGAEAKEPLTVSGSVALVSEYKFRGISLSDKNPAVQGAIGIAHDSGVYAGLWSSSTDGFGEVGGTNMELDLYAGWKGDVAPDTSLDAGLLYYAYPGSKGGHYEFFEPYAQVSRQFGPVNANVGVNFAPSQKATGSNSNIYVHGELAAALAGTPVTLKAHIGHSKGDTPLSPTGAYTDWSLGADVAWKNLTAGIAWVDTDLKAADAAAAGTRKSVFGSAFVATLTASF